MPLNYSFAGKRVLITGGGQGIGRTLVQRFHDDGAIVFTVDKNEETIKKLREELPKVRAEVVDLTNWQASKAMVESFGPIDHLVNNAGVLMFQSLLDITEEAAALTYNVNVNAAICVTQTVAKGMTEAKIQGTVVNIGSMGARKVKPLGSLYSASKAALAVFTKSTALELGSHGIRANCVLPGPVDAPMAKVDGKPLPVVQVILDQMSIQRMVDSNEVADLIMFLSSPLSAMITGEEVVIDGGWQMS